MGNFTHSAVLVSATVSSTGSGWSAIPLSVRPTRGVAALSAAGSAEIASLAAARATKGEIDDIAKLSKDHLAAFADVDEMLRTDEAFHEAIFRASRNDLLLATYRMIIPELTEVRRRRFTGRGVPARSGTEHDNVVTFLKRGDSAGARAAIRGQGSP